MQYWSGSNVSIILIDGSQKRIDKDILCKFHKNIIYIHSPKDYSKRIKSFLYKIKTEYVILGCDDEFYIPSALNSCLKNLIKERELSVCGGLVWGFEFNNKSMLGFDVYPERKKIFLSQLNPNIRLQKHFSNYNSTHIYSVCRTDLFKIIVEEVFKKKSPYDDCYCIHEILFEFLMCYSGKSKVIPELMTLRSGENENIYWLKYDEKIGLNFFKKKYIFERLDYWWLDKNNKSKKDELIKFVKLCYKKIDTINKNIFPCNVENIFENYVKFLQKNKKPFYIYFKLFYRYLPLFLRENIKELFKPFGYFKDNFKKINMFKSINLLKKKAYVDVNQLKNIENIVKDFYKN